MTSSEVVGCQSIGRMRSSNWEEVRSFHFLMIVHMIAIPPTLAAMTMSIVNVVRVILDDDPEATAEVLGAALDAFVVIVTWTLVGVAAAGEVVTAVMGGREAVVEVELEDDEDELEVVELELELVCVSGPKMLLRPKGSEVEEDEEDEEEEEEEEEDGTELKEVGVFWVGLRVLDMLGVDVVALLVEEGLVVLVLDGGLAPAPFKSGPTPWGEGARFLIRRLRLA